MRNGKARSSLIAVDRTLATIVSSECYSQTRRRSKKTKPEKTPKNPP